MLTEEIETLKTWVAALDYADDSEFAREQIKKEIHGREDVSHTTWTPYSHERGTGLLEVFGWDLPRVPMLTIKFKGDGRIVCS